MSRRRLKTRKESINPRAFLAFLHPPQETAHKTELKIKLSRRKDFGHRSITPLEGRKRRTGDKCAAGKRKLHVGGTWSKKNPRQIYTCQGLPRGKGERRRRKFIFPVMRVSPPRNPRRRPSTGRSAYTGLRALIQREKERETRLRRNWSWHPPPQCMVCRSVVWRSAGGTIFGLLFPANALSPPLEAWVKWKNAAVGIVRRQTLSFFCDPPIVFESILC